MFSDNFYAILCSVLGGIGLIRALSKLSTDGDYYRASGIRFLWWDIPTLRLIGTPARVVRVIWALSALAILIAGLMMFVPSLANSALIPFFAIIPLRIGMWIYAYKHNTPESDSVP